MEFVKSVRPTIPDVKEEEIKYLQNFLKNFLSPIVQYAKETKVPIYAIDDEQYNMERNDSIEYDLGTRNGLFAEKIQRLFKSKTCTKAVFLVGAAHIGSTNLLQGHLSLNQHMKKLGLNFHSIYNSSYDSEILNPVTNLNKCNIELPATSFVLEVDKRNRTQISPLLFDLNENEYINLNNWDLPRYSDFDFIVINK